MGHLFFEIEAIFCLDSTKGAQSHWPLGYQFYFFGKTFWLLSYNLQLTTTLLYEIDCEPTWAWVAKISAFNAVTPRQLLILIFLFLQYAFKISKSITQPRTWWVPLALAPKQKFLVLSGVRIFLEKIFLHFVNLMSSYLIFLTI